MGEDIPPQKKRFCGREQGPESPENVLHLVDLGYEKEIVKDAILKGSEDASGSVDGIKF